jgi:RNA polymerase sigma-70 factor (ECF subfamily)
MGDELEKITDERDAGAFRSLFLIFCPKLRAMLMRQGADRETAEDIAQETMFTVWRKSHQFSNDRGSIAAWIYTIARNLRVDWVRKHAVWQRYHEEFETIERLHTPVDELRSWEQEEREIEAALGRLPAEQLQIIQLTFVDGLSQREIAARLDLPLGTVKSRMRLAFEKLRCSGEREA